MANLIFTSSDANFILLPSKCPSISYNLRPTSPFSSHTWTAIPTFDFIRSLGIIRVFLGAFYRIAVVLRKTWRFVSCYRPISSSQVIFGRLKLYIFLFFQVNTFCSPHLIFLGWILFAIEWA